MGCAHNVKHMPYMHIHIYLGLVSNKQIWGTKRHAAMQQYEITYDSQVHNSKRKWRVARVLRNAKSMALARDKKEAGSGPTK